MTRFTNEIHSLAGDNAVKSSQFPAQTPPSSNCFPLPTINWYKKQKKHRGFCQLLGRIT